jgi:hypothetical protein
MPVEGKAEEDQAQEKIRAVFLPYQQGFPRVEGITPGMKINKTNAQSAREVLPPEILKVVEAGDLEISVQETVDQPLPQEYIATTLKHSTGVEINDGQLKNYVTGLPFPLLDPQDPQAGEKAAWNHRYRERGKTLEFGSSIGKAVDGAGRAQRDMEFYQALAFGLHLASEDQDQETWEKEGVYLKEYMESLAPLDQAGTVMVRYRYDRDTKPDMVWAYTPSTRRIRKSVFNPLEAVQGLDLLDEDRLVYNGYIHGHTWKLLTTAAVVLAPFALPSAVPQMGGKGEWYPVDPWQLRKAVVVEAIPHDANHPYGRRVFYFDQQTWTALYVLVYDREGRHWRTIFGFYADPAATPWNTGVQVPVMTGASWVDYQKGRAMVWIVRKAVYNQPLSSKLFSTQQLLRRGK